MIYPVYRKLRAAFYEAYPFKDVHQSWFVEVDQKVMFGDELILFLFI
jgi:hypothetical protein